MTVMVYTLKLYPVVLCLAILAYADGAIARNKSNIDAMGLTFETHVVDRGMTSNVFSASCQQASGKSCNPLIGDTVCAAILPVLCFLDIDAPIPGTLPESSPNARYWTGGILSLSSPVKASRFQTIKDVNEYCALTFGTGWRVSSCQDGTPPQSPKKVWVDTKANVDATCWSR